TVDLLEHRIDDQCLAAAAARQQIRVSARGLVEELAEQHRCPPQPPGCLRSMTAAAASGDYRLRPPAAKRAPTPFCSAKEHIMQPSRRTLLRLAMGTGGLAAMRGFGRGQTYPAGPVRLLVGYAPGGVTDIGARLIGAWLSERLGQQFVVENRPGASSNIATGTVARAAPDGYTLLLASTSNAFNAALYDRLDFNFIRDLAPVASIARDAFVLVANPSFSARTVPELIDAAKATPGKITLGSSGPASASALFGELFKVKAGADLLTVHYRSVGPALPDLMSGRVDVLFAPVASVVGSIESSKLRPLGVTTAERIEALPD